MRDTQVRRVVEDILADATHRDLFRAVEFVAKFASEAEAVLTAEQAEELASQLIEIVLRHVTDLETLTAIRTDLNDLRHRCPV